MVVRGTNVQLLPPLLVHHVPSILRNMDIQPNIVKINVEKEKANNKTDVIDCLSSNTISSISSISTIDSFSSTSLYLSSSSSMLCTVQTNSISSSHSSSHTTTGNTSTTSSYFIHVTIIICYCQY